MRGGDVSPAVEGAGSGSRGSTQAESRPTNKKKRKHTVTKDKSSVTDKQARTASSGERLRIRQRRSGQHRNREASKTL